MINIDNSLNLENVIISKDKFAERNILHEENIFRGLVFCQIFKHDIHSQK